MIESPLSSPSSSSSSCASFSSFEDVALNCRSNNTSSSTLKLLCSYGGKILPRYPDGKLRYFGGHTRVLSVGRSVSYSELMAKMVELCGWSSTVSVRCQLPTEDLDALVSITGDEDLASLIEEYDLASRDRLLPLKIKAFLQPAIASSKSLNPVSPPAACATRYSGGGRPVAHPRFHGNPWSRPVYLVGHHGNYWQ